MLPLPLRNRNGISWGFWGTTTHPSPSRNFPQVRSIDIGEGLVPSYRINGFNLSFGTGETLNVFKNLESTNDFGHNGCQEDQIIALMNVYTKWLSTFLPSSFLLKLKVYEVLFIVFPVISIEKKTHTNFADNRETWWWRGWSLVL